MKPCSIMLTAWEEICVQNSAFFFKKCFVTLVQLDKIYFNNSNGKKLVSYFILTHLKKILVLFIVLCGRLFCTQPCALLEICEYHILMYASKYISYIFQTAIAKISIRNLWKFANV